MGKTIGAAVAVIGVIALILFFMFFHRVDPGQQGILVDYTFNQNGKPRLEFKQPGSYYFVGPNQRLVEYPISQQTLTMVQNKNEGKVTGDDSVGVTDENGIPINIEVSLFWRVDPNHIGDLYLLRPGVPLNGHPNADIEDLVVRQGARSVLGLVASNYTFADLLGAKKANYQAAVKTELSKDLSSEYIVLDDIQVRNILLQPDQQKAISDKANAQQAVQTADQNAQKADKDAQAVRNKAAGDKDAAIAEAQAQEQALNLQGQGQAEQIDQVKKALGTSDPNVIIAYLQTQKWNGQQPTTIVSNNGSAPPPGVILNSASH